MLIVDLKNRINTSKAKDQPRYLEASRSNKIGHMSHFNWFAKYSDNVRPIKSQQS